MDDVCGEEVHSGGRAGQGSKSFFATSTFQAKCWACHEAILWIRDSGRSKIQMKTASQKILETLADRERNRKDATDNVKDILSIDHHYVYLLSGY